MIVLARHGATEWSVARRHTGLTDLPLTALGEREARALGERLPRGAVAYTSPLRRAADTAALAGFPDAERRGELVEWDYGDYEGLTTPEIRERRPGWVLFTDGCPGGEDAEAVGARVDPLVEELRDRSDDVVVFAHGHVLRALAARWVGLPASGAAYLHLSTATLSELGFEREQPVIHRWNA